MKRSQAMMRVRFVKDAHLPRYVMQAGEEWDLQKNHMTESGFSVGGGFVTPDFYEVVPRGKS